MAASAVADRTRPVPAEERAAALAARFEGRAAEEILADLLAMHPGEVALVSSFGAESVVLLHMVARIDPATPVLFLETGMLFPETLAHQREVAERLGLQNIRVIRPDATDIALLDGAGKLHAENPDGCCHLRKTLPLRRALAPFAVSVTGRKRSQGATRAQMLIVEAEPGSGRLKVNPLAGWGREAVAAYMEAHALPRHPLIAKGYPSIGCAPCTTRTRPGEHARAGRWRGREKTECGIHFDGTAWVRTAPAAQRAAR